jgi:hypothetical protein
MLFVISEEIIPFSKNCSGKGHEKYSPPASAAIRGSCEAIQGGGDLSAIKVSLRWLMMP